MTCSFTSFLLSALLTTSSAFGASFSTTASADAFVATGPGGNLANDNYGGAGSLSVAATGLPQGELQSVLQFNLGAAASAFDVQFGAGQWSVQSVTLQLTATSANNPIFNTPAAGSFGISWMKNDSWLEGVGTPTAPGTAGVTFSSLQNSFIGAGDENLGTFQFNGATSGATTYTLTLTPGLVSDLAAGDNVSLRLFAADSAVSAVFNSRNFGTVANRPLLTVEAVPEPATMTLGGLGILLILVLRPRKDIEGARC
jgi:hypothetical protein